MFETSPYFVAEISGNHLGQLSVATELVREAAEAGADAVKLQTYTADSMTLNLDSVQFQVSPDHSLWGGRNLYELYEEAHTPREWHDEIFTLAKELGMSAFSTPFDEDSVRFLETLDVPAFKVASLEIVDHPLLERIGQTGKPVLLSTGTASLAEIVEAIDVLRLAGSGKITPLVCTSSYPASASDSNLRRIKTLQLALGGDIGLSDHTLGIAVPIAAIALGATVIEKHLTLDRGRGGPDSAFSLEPSEFREMIEAGRAAQSALGSGEFIGSASESESIRLRPSLWVTENVRKGDLVSRSNVASLRPSGGLHPKHFPAVVGRKFKEDLPLGAALSWQHLD